MKTKILFSNLLLSFLLIANWSFADEKPVRDGKILNPDFNSKLPQQVLRSYHNESDAIGAAWTTLATSPNAVSRSCVVYARPGGTEYIYQFGGGAGTQLKSIARYDIAANTWTVLAQTLNLDLSSGTAINYGDSVIYLFGGNSGTATLGSTQKFNIGTGVVTTLASMPTAVTDAAVVKYHDSLVYVIGGGDGLFGAVVYNTVQVYNIKTNTYAAATSYPVATAMMGCGIDGNKIIVAAGWNGTTGTAASYKGEISAGNHLVITWTALPNYPGGTITRSASAFVSKGSGRGVVFTGGAINGATLTNKTYFFYTDCEQWDSTAANSLARSNFKAASRGDSVAWVAGGFTTVGVGTTERITFSLINCAQFTNDVASISINNPGATIILPSGSITPQATVKNVGTATQSFNVTMTISPGGYSSTQNVAGLTANSTANVNFGSYTPVIGNYTVTVYTQLATDQNRLNDTIRQSLAVINPNYGAGGGYFFSNSVTGSGAPSQPQYCWKDTSGSISLVVNSVNVQTGIFTGTLDDGVWRIGNNLGGRKIKLGGISYDSFFVTTNGVIGFAFNSSLTSFSPSTTSTNRPAFYPLWMDQDFRAQLAGGQPNRISYKIYNGFQLIITYDRAPEYNSGVITDTTDYCSYQIVVDLVESTYPDNSRILVQYADTSGGKTGKNFVTYYNTNVLNNHVVGVQNASGSTNLYYRAAYPVTITGPLFGSSPIAVQFGSNVNTLNSSCSSSTLNLNASLQVITPNISPSHSRKDTITVSLRETTSPYGIVDVAKGVLDSLTNCTLNFFKVSLGSSYYIVINHRNSIETWSAAGVPFPTSSVSYDFTSNVNQAFGGNQIVVLGEASVYTGDPNQDGAVDLSDLVLIFNDAGLFVSGYVVTDVSNDDFVDLTDLAFTYNNSVNFVGVIRP